MCEEESHAKTTKKSVEGISYFNTKKERQGILTPFERAQHVNEGYKEKLHRDDREHTLDLDINGEERSRKIPVLSSSEYGRRPPIEQPSRDHARVSLIQRDFYRTSSEGTI